MPSEPKPRFLAPITKPRDYVDRPELAVHGEPECIGPAIVNGYTESARFHESVRHQVAVEAALQARPLLATEDRIRDAERRAKASHRNLGHEFHIMRRDLERARAGGRTEPDRVHRRLERLEADLDGRELERIELGMRDAA